MITCACVRVRACACVRVHACACLCVRGTHLLHHDILEASGFLRSLEELVGSMFVQPVSAVGFPTFKRQN